MFGKRDGDMNSRRFWSWFASEAQGIANALEALQRGESDAEWAMIGLNERIRRFDPALEADVARTLDGRCHMTISGPDARVHALLERAPRLAGWRFTSRESVTDTRRVPFRLTPRPSLDSLASPISARHEAYAV